MTKLVSILIATAGITFLSVTYALKLSDLESRVEALEASRGTKSAGYIDGYPSGPENCISPDASSPVPCGPVINAAKKKPAAKPAEPEKSVPVTPGLYCLFLDDKPPTIRPCEDSNANKPTLSDHDRITRLERYVDGIIDVVEELRGVLLQLRGQEPDVKREKL